MVPAVAAAASVSVSIPSAGLIQASRETKLYGLVCKSALCVLLRRMSSSQEDQAEFAHEELIVQRTDFLHLLVSLYVFVQAYRFLYSICAPKEKMLLPE